MIQLLTLTYVHNAVENTTLHEIRNTQQYVKKHVLAVFVQSVYAISSRRAVFTHVTSNEQLKFMELTFSAP